MLSKHLHSILIDFESSEQIAVEIIIIKPPITIVFQISFGSLITKGLINKSFADYEKLPMPKLTIQLLARLHLNFLKGSLKSENY